MTAKLQWIICMDFTSHIQKTTEDYFTTWYTMFKQVQYLKTKQYRV